MSQGIPTSDDAAEDRQKYGSGRRNPVDMPTLQPGHNRLERITDENGKSDWNEKPTACT